MSAILRVEAPTDAQLSFIAKLCREQGWQMPGAVYSKTEASEIISAMLASTYDAEQYRAPSGAPTYDDADCYCGDDFLDYVDDDDGVPF